MEPLIYVALTALATVLSGGTIVGLLRLRTDKTSAIVQTAQEFSASVSTTARELIVPLTEQLAHTRRDSDEKVAVVRERVAVLEKEVLVSRDAEKHCQDELLLRDERIAALEAQLGGRRAVDEDRIEALRAEVARLGGSVDEINRKGKTGEQGPVGEKGPPGEPG